MRKNTQWISEMRKYPNHETFAVGDLVLVYHPLGSVLQSPSRRLNRNWVGPLRIQTSPRQYTLSCVQIGVEC